MNTPIDGQAQGPKVKFEDKELPLFDVISLDDTYTRNKKLVIKLQGVKKIASKFNLVEKKSELVISPNSDNFQQHAVNIWVGVKGIHDVDCWVRGYGEASMLNTGKVSKDASGKASYDHFDKIDSQYRYSMANSRAFTRAILAFVELYGVYADVEFPDFTNDEKDNGTPTAINY